MMQGLSQSPAHAVKKSEPEPTPEELQARMQHMIDLQYAAQGMPSSSISPPPTVSAPKGRTIIPGSIHYPKQNYAATSATTNATTMKTIERSLSPESEGIGQGQLFFASDYPRQPPEQTPILHNTMDNPYTHYGSPPHLEDHEQPLHEFHYGNPDHYQKQHHDRRRGQDSSYCCFWDALLHWIMVLQDAENLHRSFCYGAIDGMLTGSGIVATFLGMGVLTATSSMATRWFVVGFALAACTSDAICMALGHVWSTFVMTNASAVERRTQRLSFEQNRAETKGKLVDMLLTRGMLKIDAMSIADTLEGYPDIFVSALVGDSGYMLGEESSLNPSGSALGLTPSAGINPEDGDYSHGHYPNSPFTRPQHRSYGQFNEWDYDPEAAGVVVAMSESRMEGVVMMLSFSFFSVLPALVNLGLSTIIPPHPSGDGAISISSMSMSITSGIMLLLGIWKSRFFDSNWIMFGVETVVVLFLCVMSAYVLGSVLSTVLPSIPETASVAD